MINVWNLATGFHVMLSPNEISTIKRINTYTNNLIRSDKYEFLYSKNEQETLNGVREKWIEFLKTMRM